MDRSWKGKDLCNRVERILSYSCAGASYRNRAIQPGAGPPCTVGAARPPARKRVREWLLPVMTIFTTVADRSQCTLVIAMLCLSGILNSAT